MSDPRLPHDYLRIPERLNMAVEVLDRQIQAGRADKAAIRWGAEVLTYGALQTRVNRCGNALKQLGLQRGDRYLIRSHNCPDYIVAALGGLKIGAVPIPTSSLFRAREIEYILQNSEAKLAFTLSELLGPFEEVRKNCPALKQIVLFDHAPREGFVRLEELLASASPELRAEPTAAEDLAFMIYTSGTTGVPKGVQHAQRWLIGAGHPVCHVLMQMTPEDIVFFPNELSFMYAWGCSFLFPLYMGASVVLWPGRFDPEKCLEYLHRYRVTQFVAVPTALRMILNVKGLEKKCAPPALRWCLSGGEPLPAATYHEFLERFGVEIFDAIGQSEIHLYLGNRKGLRVKPGSMGTPFPGHRVAVVDDAGRLCGPGELGHLAIERSDPGLAVGYCQVPEIWAQRFRGAWFDTGDLAHIDGDGYFWYESRSDDLIKSRAYLISPREVEAAVLEHPAVLEAGVVGVPDEVMGKRVKAFVVLRTGHAPFPNLMEEIQDACRARIAPYKVPKEIAFVPQLPKTATGKILRRSLRGEG